MKLRVKLAARLRLRNRGAILLISCYELGHQPLGIAQPLAFLEEAGYQPTALDIAVTSLDEKAIEEAQFVGISVPMHTALRLGVQAAELVRELNSLCHICFFGLYASLNAEYLLQHVADSVIGGEYTAPLVSLVGALEKDGSEEKEGRVSIRQVDGVSTRGRVVIPVLSRSPPTIPAPSRRALAPLGRYAKLEHDGQERLVGYVEASRGCLHQCLHCPIVPVYEGRLVLVPEESVIEDIRRLVESGATHMTFGDPDFLNGPGHSMKILRAMHTEFPRLTFDFTAKIEHLLKRRSLFPQLRALGCLFVVSAVESFSDTVLDRLEKGHTRADVIQALGILRPLGITLRPSLVAFTPWTTRDDYLEMFEMVLSHDLVDAIDPVQYTIRLLVPPGSALLQRSDIARFLSGLDQSSFQYRWTHPDPCMDRLHERATAAVQEGTRQGQDPLTLFQELRTLAYRLADQPAPTVSIRHAHDRQKAPRLTEPWFCCAEPTESQLTLLRTTTTDPCDLEPAGPTS
jgi:radical SAM superfamily enzyme YgiQ (UPF0313 family)